MAYAILAKIHIFYVFIVSFLKLSYYELLEGILSHNLTDNLLIW